MSDPAPQQLGKFRLGQLLATGGMGEVFLAKNEGPAGFAKTVVLKKILPHLARDPQFVDMFLNEARLAALLSHPNIVQIFELGQQDDTYFIAMEYIHGRSLRAIKQKLLERKQLFSPILAARLCSHALQGLHYAHTLADETGAPLNVVHRDISPDNVLVSFNGQVKLVDFGIAKAANAVTTTRTGTIKGKYAYMAPEQLLATGADGRIDVYATGVLLYELLTGTRPYHAPTEPALIAAILNTQPPPPRERNPSLPQEIDAIILKALEKDPDRRFATADEMSNALESFVTSTGQTLTPSNVGTFLRELFAVELAQGPVVAQPGSTRPPTHPSSPSNPSLPREEAVVAPAPASVLQREVGTPASQRERDRLRQLETAALAARVEPAEAPTIAVPASEEISGVVAKAGKTPRPAGRATPTLPATNLSSTPQRGPSTRALAIGGIVGAVVLILGGVALVFARGDADAKVPEPRPISRAAPSPAGPVSPSAEKTSPAEIAPTPSPPPEEKKEALVEAEPEAEVATDSEADLAPSAPAEPDPAPTEAPAKHRSTKHAVVRREPKAKGPGKVSFRVNPWAEVFFAGKSLGITPMPPVTIPAGRQTFTLKNPQLGINKKVTVNVPAGGSAVVRTDMFE